jgi:hypothetical protein
LFETGGWEAASDRMAAPALTLTCDYCATKAAFLAAALLHKHDTCALSPLLIARSCTQTIRDTYVPLVLVKQPSLRFAQIHLRVHHNSRGGNGYLEEMGNVYIAILALGSAFRIFATP